MPTKEGYFYLHYNEVEKRMAANLERAIEIAREAHRGEMRRDGSLYIYHPQRVMAAVAINGGTVRQQILAVVHDVPENHSDIWPIERFRDEEGYDDELLVWLDVITRREGVPYDEYIQRIGEHPDVIPVKLEDMDDNLIHSPTPEQIIKYGRAIRYFASLEQVAVQ